MTSGTQEAIPAEVVELIREIIEHPTQEGGWKLTENPNDPDGGWTYAGVTSKTYNEFLAKLSPHAVCSYSTIRDIVDGAIDLPTQRELNENIIKIYFNEYYIPARAVVRNLLQEPGLELEGYELSCVVNVGLAAFEQIANEAHASESSHELAAHEGHFCYHWMMHYIRLVQKNAEAWQASAKAFQNCYHNLQHGRDIGEAVCPKTLRAEFLAGWFNRVEHWRGTE